MKYEGPLPLWQKLLFSATRRKHSTLPRFISKVSTQKHMDAGRHAILVLASLVLSFFTMLSYWFLSTPVHLLAALPFPPSVLRFLSPLPVFPSLPACLEIFRLLRLCLCFNHNGRSRFLLRALATSGQANSHCRCRL